MTMTELDPDRVLALAYVPGARRAAVEALWRLDVALGAVPATGRDPMVGRIRLAWWREALERLDAAPPPPEPVLEGIARHLLPAGVAGAELAAMEEGWAVLLAPERLTPDELELYAAARGGRLFRLTARLLGAEGETLEADGESWALVDLARRSRDPAEAAATLDAARKRAGRARWPRSLRPLGMLAALTRRDLRRGAGRWERPGSPARMMRMLGHRLTGH
jgi:phytoene synthase